MFKIVEAHGSRFQFGGTPKVGCADGLFTIKTLLNLRCNHNHETYVAFVDLVEVFDTADTITNFSSRSLRSTEHLLTSAGSLSECTQTLLSS